MVVVGAIVVDVVGGLWCAGMGATRSNLVVVVGATVVEVLVVVGSVAGGL